MGLVCGTPTSFVPAAAAADTAAAQTAQATTITPALGAGVKNQIDKTEVFVLHNFLCVFNII